MSLFWQDVACGLPVPALPLAQGFATRFFTAALVVPAADLARLREVAHRLREAGQTVRLSSGFGAAGVGADWLCRLTEVLDATPLEDGRWRVLLEFEVVQPDEA